MFSSVLGFLSADDNKTISRQKFLSNRTIGQEIVFKNYILDGLIELVQKLIVVKGSTYFCVWK